jgi:hypothetical protein
MRDIKLLLGAILAVLVVGLGLWVYEGTDLFRAEEQNTWAEWNNDNLKGAVQAMSDMVEEEHRRITEQGRRIMDDLQAEQRLR